MSETQATVLLASFIIFGIIALVEWTKDNPYQRRKRKRRNAGQGDNLSFMRLKKPLSGAYQTQLRG